MIRGVLIAVLRFYRRWVGPMFGQHCRFHPSWSAYALEAIDVHGAGRGSVYTLWRLLRCHPWCAGGFDPVPPSKSSEPQHG